MVRAIYGFSVAVFGFTLDIIVLDIADFLAKRLIFGKMGHFTIKLIISQITITARANPKTATERP